MKTDRKILIEGRRTEIHSALMKALDMQARERNEYDSLVSRCAVVAERAEILDKLIKESTDQDWQE